MHPDDPLFPLDLAAVDLSPAAASRQRARTLSAVHRALAPGFAAALGRGWGRVEPLVAGAAAVLYVSWALGQVVGG
jgi:hypothetical protein